MCKHSLSGGFTIATGNEAGMLGIDSELHLLRTGVFVLSFEEKVLTDFKSLNMMRNEG